MKTTKHRDLIYDVGLHEGEDSEFYLKKGFRVIAFEADPELAERTRKRLASFIENGRLTIIEGAIVDESFLRSGQKTITFYKSDFSVCGTVHQQWKDRNAVGGVGARAIDVDVVDFASCMQTHGVPYYLKIDIEGSDIYCLQALLKFDLKPDFVSIETEHADASRLDKELSLMEQLGYDRFKAIQQHRLKKLVPPFPAKEGTYVPYEFPEAASGLFGRELPGTWLTKGEILEQLKRYIWQYTFWGARGIQRNWLGQRIHGVVKRLLRSPLPGWYDTHAKHSSVPE